MVVQIQRNGKLKEDQMAGLYEHLATERRIIFLYGALNQFPLRQDVWGPQYIVDSILAMSSISDDPIWLVIDSPGGDVHEGYSILDAMKYSPVPVYTIGRNCFSMAAILLSGGEPGHRYVYPHSKAMLHLPFGSIIGDERDIKIRAGEMTRLKNELVDIMIENGVRVDRKNILSDIDRELWLSAEDTIKYGLADKVIDDSIVNGMLRGKTVMPEFYTGEPYKSPRRKKNDAAN